MILLERYGTWLLLIVALAGLKVSHHSLYNLPQSQTQEDHLLAPTSRLENTKKADKSDAGQYT